MTNPITGELLEAFKLLLDPDMAEDESLDEHEVMEKAYKALDNYNPAKLEQVREVLKTALKLSVLMEDPQPGLLTWLNSHRERRDEVVQEVNQLDPEIKAWALREGE